jgi:voltage-gated potassium channel Kch
MALQQSSEALRRPFELLRIGFAFLAAFSLVIGYLGFTQLVAVRDDLGHRPLDIIYYDLQLFVLGADPLQDPGPYPMLLEIARFTAPAATVYAMFEAARLLFAVEFSRWKARRARGHVIVCGDTALADTLSQRLQERGVVVVEVRTLPDEFVTAGEPLRIIGDARDPRVLRAAGIDGAAAVYACASGNAVNVAIALAASSIRAGSTAPLAVHSHIPDHDLCSTFQAMFLSRPRPGPIRLDFFNVNTIAARRLFTDHPLVPLAGRAPRLMVAGAGEFAAAAVVAAARSWRVVREDGQRLPVTLVDVHARSAVDDLVRRYPFLTAACDFSVRDADLLPLLSGGQAVRSPDRLIVCHQDEELALKSAMAAERLWRGELESIVVRLDGLARFLDEDGPVQGVRLLDGGAGLLRPFGVLNAACDPDLIGEDLVERLAHVIHERYRQGRRARGEWSDGDPSLLPWDELSPRLRLANRAQAEDIGRKLAEVNCAISPRFGRDADISLSEVDLEYLARLEHERWCTEHVEAGWSFAEQRSEEDKHHPGLRPWHALPEQFRRRTHDAVRELTDILADAGFKIVRG